MNLPKSWTPEIWRRATVSTVPSVQEVDGHLVSEITVHHADYAGEDLWTVDYLPGRWLTRRQAVVAMRIAMVPELPEVERWAAELGLTAAEARGYAAMPTGVQL